MLKYSISLLQQPSNRTLDVAKTLSNALGIELGTLERSVGVVVLEVGGGLGRSQFVEGIGCDVVDIDKLATSLTCHSTAP